jgi:hypothetical protein
MARIICLYRRSWHQVKQEIVRRFNEKWSFAKILEFRADRDFDLHIVHLGDAARKFWIGFFRAKGFTTQSNSFRRMKNKRA